MNGLPSPPVEYKPCRWCIHWEQNLGDGIVCGKHRRHMGHWHAERGCVDWRREPGSDDDLGDPPRQPEPNPYL